MTFKMPCVTYNTNSCNEFNVDNNYCRMRQQKLLSKSDSLHFVNIV